MQTTLPTQLTAGDKWEWELTLSDYADAVYSVYLYLAPVGGGSVLSYLHTQSAGGAFTITVASATTAAVSAGDYRATLAAIDSSSNRTTVSTGQIKVLPNPATTTADTRTHARKTLDAIRAVIEGRATLDQSSMSVNGRSISRTPISELLTLENRYAQLVKQEEAALSIANGGKPRQIQVRLR